MKNKGALAVFITIAIACFLSAIFPKWDLRWGRHSGGGKFEDRIPVSVRGRVAFGMLFVYFCAVGLIGDVRPSWGSWLGVSVFLPLLGVFLIAWQDERRHFRKRKNPVGPTDDKAT
jgi:hypothetical protein